jgi:hypothetical protein
MKAFAAGLVVVLAITGCSSSTPPPEPTAAPRTEPIELPTLPATSAATVPVVTVTTVPAATTTTLPYGLTDADRAAVEAAATEWFAEWRRQMAALPEFDPNPFFELAEPGSPAAAEYAVILENLFKKRLVLIPSTVSQTVVRSVRFENQTLAEAVVCIADDAGFKESDTGAIETPAVLGRLSHRLTLKKLDRWRLSSDVRSEDYEEGKSCADPF